MDGRTDRPTDRHRQTDGRTDRWMDTDTQTYTHTDRQTDKGWLDEFELEEFGTTGT